MKRKKKTKADGRAIGEPLVLPSQVRATAEVSSDGRVAFTLSRADATTSPFFPKWAYLHLSDLDEAIEMWAHLSDAIRKAKAMKEAVK